MPSMYQFMSFYVLKCTSVCFLMPEDVPVHAFVECVPCIGRYCVMGVWVAIGEGKSGIRASHRGDVSSEQVKKCVIQFY